LVIPCHLHICTSSSLSPPSFPQVINQPISVTSGHSTTVKGKNEHSVLHHLFKKKAKTRGPGWLMSSSPALGAKTTYKNKIKYIFKKVKTKQLTILDVSRDEEQLKISYMLGGM